MSERDDAAKARDDARRARIGDHIRARNAGMIEGLGCAATIALALGQSSVAAAIVAEMRRQFPDIAGGEISQRGL